MIREHGIFMRSVRSKFISPLFLSIFLLNSQFLTNPSAFSQYIECKWEDEQLTTPTKVITKIAINNSRIDSLFCSNYAHVFLK